MPQITIFQDDAFSVTSLTAAINDVPAVPSRLADLNLFDEEGISTTTFQIEKDGTTLQLVKSAPRGSSGQVVNGSKRNLIPFNTVHLPERATILADEIQNVRAFGTETELQSVQTIVNGRLQKMRQQLDATHEWQRIGAVKGQVLDADGSTVLLDVYETFGLEQEELPFNVVDADVDLLVKCSLLLDMIEDALAGVPFKGARVLCGKNFWNALIVVEAIKETYRATQAARALARDPREDISFGGATFERYRGKIGSTAYIGDDDAYAYPEGVPSLFISRYAPADYMETVNTNGLPYYSKQKLLDYNKGVEIEAQSNPLHLCTRPLAVIKLKKGAS